MNCIKCGSFAINEGSYDRMRGVDSNLCDPHYWMKKATELEAQLAAAWIPVSQRLPVEGESVFVFSKYGQSDLADFIGGAFENYWMIDDEDETITHWIGKPPHPPIDKAIVGGATWQPLYLFLHGWCVGRLVVGKRTGYD